VNLSVYKREWKRRRKCRTLIEALRTVGRRRNLIHSEGGRRPTGVQHPDSRSQSSWISGGADIWRESELSLSPQQPSPNTHRRGGLLAFFSSSQICLFHCRRRSEHNKRVRALAWVTYSSIPVCPQFASICSHGDSPRTSICSYMRAVVLWHNWWTPQQLRFSSGVHNLVDSFLTLFNRDCDRPMRI
jgi:hypothetical protein